MECNIHHEKDYAIIQLRGEVDMSTSPKARKSILSCLKKKQALLVDLSGVDYIDSSGIASLVEGYQYARDHTQNFALIGVSEIAMSVLQLARLDRVFPIFKDVEQWLKNQQ